MNSDFCKETPPQKRPVNRYFIDIDTGSIESTTSPQGCVKEFFDYAGSI
jgi:hypothetical protein